MIKYFVGLLLSISVVSNVQGLTPPPSDYPYYSDEPSLATVLPLYATLSLLCLTLIFIILLLIRKRIKDKAKNKD